MLYQFRRVGGQLDTNRVCLAKEHLPTPTHRPVGVIHEYVSQTDVISKCGANLSGWPLVMILEVVSTLSNLLAYFVCPYNCRSVWL